MHTRVVTVPPCELLGVSDICDLRVSDALCACWKRLSQVVVIVHVPSVRVGSACRKLSWLQVVVLRTCGLEIILRCSNHFSFLEFVVPDVQITVHFWSLVSQTFKSPFISEVCCPRRSNHRSFLEFVVPDVQITVHFLSLVSQTFKSPFISGVCCPRRSNHRSFLKFGVPDVQITVHF